MLSNLPAATGVNLDPDTVGGMASEGANTYYLKDTSADIAPASQLNTNPALHVAFFAAKRANAGVENLDRTLRVR
ncbi:hypothetical protein ACQ856_29620 (plasmid) [Mycolicibacterium psychrotolerans]|uniref:hypothetical protein n=1 Tax=Mycolicibacterium psychrotolerans TaxID=216929 RepID=UPI003D66A98D